MHLLSLENTGTPNLYLTATRNSAGYRLRDRAGEGATLRHEPVSGLGFPLCPLCPYLSSRSASPPPFCGDWVGSPPYSCLASVASTSEQKPRPPMTTASLACIHCCCVTWAPRILHSASLTMLSNSCYRSWRGKELVVLNVNMTLGWNAEAKNGKL